MEHDAIQSLGDVPPAKVIASYHNFKETPPSLAAIHAQLVRTGAAVVKVAAMANHILDAAAVLRLLADARTPTIALSMGPRGVITRVLAHKFGGFLTYAAPASAADTAKAGPREAAPGQVSIADMREPLPRRPNRTRRPASTASSPTPSATASARGSTTPPSPNLASTPSTCPCGSRATPRRSSGP